MRATVSLPHRSQKESWGAVNQSAAEGYVRWARWVTSDQPDASTTRGYYSATDVRRGLEVGHDDLAHLQHRLRGGGGPRLSGSSISW